ncbi:PREDICTED: uncharacterized protein LOC109174447 [Ipomoea nil]|uniref:uncharacterized protein LOC109174447 n=1 Tax=Ipomoea nil TaxID=35883 RepID=UPI0009013603|nr:PREDICTED: uncharacterized protein LOC109174447 [Ipomoea nil]
MLRRLGFGDRWVQLVMLCVRSVRYKVLINGRPSEEIVPTRGLRQGDLLSPYLFIICAEGLSLLLQDSQAKGLIHGCRVARGAPAISHLFFADDSLLFFKANLQEAMEVKRCLGVYEAYSGQAVNFNKSSISFNRNTLDELKDLVAGALGVSQADDFGKYLGLPSVVGRNKKLVFAYIEQKLKQRFGTWNKRLLSRAGKEVLLKSVAQAMPTYTMSIFLIPITLCASLERLMNIYWWGRSDREDSIHWLAWDRMCTPKKFGGLGFKWLHEFNLALLAKQGWRLLTNPNTLMARVLKARYYPTSTFYDAAIGGNPSYVWRSIMASQGLVKSGCRRRIGNGRTTQVWAHPWLSDSHDPYVSTAQPATNQGLIVADLVDDTTGAWNNNLIQQIFNARDAALINKLPLNGMYDDLWYWEGDITGNYSVKSGYRRLGDAFAPSSPVWSSIWRLKIPPKWKNFMWRAFSNILPTLDNLIKKRVDLVNVCPACGLVEENVMHVLCSCSYASLVWNCSQLPIPQFNGNNFLFWAELWLGGASALDCDDKGRICGLLHGIWSARNSAVWNGLLPTPAVLCCRLTSSWAAWKAYGAGPRDSQVQRLSVLHANQRQHGLACFVDAAFHNNQQHATYGFMVLEEDGSYVAAANGPMVCPYDPLMAEAMAVTEALSWLKNNGYTAVRLFTDNAVLVSSLSNARSFRSYFGFILDSCIRLISSMPGTVVSYVRRDANKAAHMLAKHENAPAVSSVWRGGPPSFFGADFG